MGLRRNVRILLLGERGVGKTSLILSLVSEEFHEDVPSKAEEITIPADVTPEQVPTHIVDYSAADQTDEQLGEEIQRAHVICVVYSLEDEDTLDRVISHWLPLIRRWSSDSRVPVVLVGNKCDLTEFSTTDALLSIMEDHPEIESCIECSAKTLKNISEMFFYAQKAVLHPTTPLFSMEKQDLTEGCVKALTRIFKISDKDNDGLLNDYELNVFQRYCFHAPLQPSVLEDVKAVIQRNISDGVTNNCITLKGFIFLHRLFIQRGRNETTWTVLRKFGYNDNLEVMKEYLHPPIQVRPGSSTELSHKGVSFFTHLFETHDLDKDGALSPVEAYNLFSACPSVPWEADFNKTVPTTDKGFITLQGFLCQWVLITLCDVQKTFEYLAYLGYNAYENDKQTSAVLVTREKQIDLMKKQTGRNVYQCHVIGQKGCGKSMFCRSFIGHSLENTPTRDLTGVSQCTVNMIQVYGQEKYLVLRDVDVHNVVEPLQPAEVQCDVACLVYDVNNPKSFEYIARLYLKYYLESKIPVLIVGNKADLPETRQDYLLQPASFCNRHKLPPPQMFTASGNVKSDIFIKLGTMAAFPHFNKMHLLTGDSAVWWKAGLSIALLTIIGFFTVKFFKADKR